MAVLAAMLLLVSLWPIVLPLEPFRWVLIFPAVLVVWGLHTALSNRRFTFTRHSRVCRCHIQVLGVLRRRHTMDFSAVTCRRQFNWQTLRWLYSIALEKRENSHRRIDILGYASSRDRAAELVETIAAFTGCDIDELP